MRACRAPESRSAFPRDIGGRGTAADERSPAGGKSAIDSLCPAQTELEHRITTRGQTDARGLGSDQGVKVHQAKQCGFQQLTLQDRPLDPHQRLVWEHSGAFRDGIDVQGQSQRAQVVEKSRLKERLAIVSRNPGQKGKIVGGKPKIPQPIDSRRQPCRDRIPTAEG